MKQNRNQKQRASQQCRCENGNDDETCGGSGLLSLDESRIRLDAVLAQNPKRKKTMVKMTKQTRTQMDLVVFCRHAEQP